MNRIMRAFVKYLERSRGALSADPCQDDPIIRCERGDCFTRTTLCHEARDWVFNRYGRGRASNLAASLGITTFQWVMQRRA
jgi:hypothetical protein